VLGVCFYEKLLNLYIFLLTFIFFTIYFLQFNAGLLENSNLIIPSLALSNKLKDRECFLLGLSGYLFINGTNFRVKAVSFSLISCLGFILLGSREEMFNSEMIIEFFVIFILI
jgi:hypothetical protein